MMKIKYIQIHLGRYFIRYVVYEQFLLSKSTTYEDDQSNGWSLRIAQESSIGFKNTRKGLTKTYHEGLFVFCIKLSKNILWKIKFVAIAVIIKKRSFWVFKTFKTDKETDSHEVSYWESIEL